MTAASLVRPELLPGAVLTAAFFWVIRWAATGRLSMRTPIDLPVAALLLMIPIALWATALPEKTTVQALRLLSGIGLYYAIANWCDAPKRLHLLLLGLMVAGGFLALTAPFSVIWPIGKLPFIPPGFYDRFLVVLADSIHPNVLAGSLILILPISLAWLLEGWSGMAWSERIFAGAVSLLLAGVLALSQSRSAWIAVVIALGLIFLLRFRWGWIGLAGLAAAGVLAFTRFGVNQLLESLLVSTSVGGLAQRQLIWSRAILIIQDFPITGIGLGSFMEVADAMYPFSPTSSGSIDHAHNLYLQIAVDLGVPGLAAWLAIFIIVIFAAVQLFRNGRQKQDRQRTALGLGVLGSQAALFFHGLTDAVTWGMVRPAPLVWAIWGLAVAGWLMLQTEEQK